MYELELVGFDSQTHLGRCCQLLMHKNIAIQYRELKLKRNRSLNVLGTNVGTEIFKNQKVTNNTYNEVLIIYVCTSWSMGRLCGPIYVTEPCYKKSPIFLKTMGLLTYCYLCLNWGIFWCTFDHKQVFVRLRSHHEVQIF